MKSNITRQQKYNYTSYIINFNSILFIITNVPASRHHFGNIIFDKDYMKIV